MTSDTGSFDAPPLGALTEGDGLHRVVVEHSHDLITVTDRHGRILYVSRSYRTQLGYPESELVGREALELVHPDDADEVARSMSVVLEGGAIEGVTVRLRHQDGHWVTVDSSGSAVLGPDGRPVVVVITARDVSEREELRSRLAELDAVYRLADAVAHSQSLDELLDVAVEALLRAIGADRGAVLLYDSNGVMRFRAWRGLSDAYRAATEGHSPWSPDTPEPQPLLVTSVEDSDFEAPLLEALRTEGIGALAFIPLVHRGRLLGKFMLYHDEPHEFGDEEIRLCRTVASHLASSAVRTQALEALRESNDRLAVILRSVGDGITVQTPDGELLYANDAAARTLGFSATEELLVTPVKALMRRFEVLDEERHPLPLDELPGRLALAGETVERLVCYRIVDTGEERWSVVRASPVRSADGSVELAVNVFHDITERKQAEDRSRFLAEASNLLGASLDYELTLRSLARLAVPRLAGQCIVDLIEDDGSIRSVAVAHADPERTELLREVRLRYPPTAPGHPVQAALATGETQFLPQLDPEAVAAMAHDEEHAEAIRRLGNTSGIVVPLLARGAMLGAITLGTVPPQPPYRPADIELAEELARRAAVAIDNARLYRSADERAQAALALAHVDDGVFLIDEDGIVRLWNPAAEVKTGIEAAAALGRRVGELIPRWDELAGRVPVAPHPSPGGSRAQTLPLELGGEERWLLISGVRFPGGTVYAFRDLTEERMVERLKSDFVSTVSHELRTPLAAIYGAALTLRRSDIRLEETQRSGLLDVIATEADRLARIVSDILWASRLDAGTMTLEIESCDAAGLARQVIEAARIHAPAEIELELDAPEELPQVAVDPDKIRQVLTNLLDNAVKYSPDGGRVTLGLERRDDRLRFRVSDEGLGIPAAEHERIWEKFYRLDPNLTRGVGGTGLGLYICRELVHRMSGWIWVESDGRNGSTFLVEVPLA